GTYHFDGPSLDNLLEHGALDPHTTDCESGRVLVEHILSMRLSLQRTGSHLTGTWVNTYELQWGDGTPMGAVVGDALEMDLEVSPRPTTNLRRRRSSPPHPPSKSQPDTCS